MKFNLAVKAEKSEAYRYFTILSNKKCVVEVKKINPKRTLSQNNYLHLIIEYFGVHFGYNLKEAKEIYKEINESIYEYQKTSKTGKTRTFYRSSAELDKEEMAKSIDRFMQVSAEQGCILPPATNQEWLKQIENEIERSKYYL